MNGLGLVSWVGTYTLIVLLLVDLVNLVKQLTHAKLQLGQLFLAGKLVVVNGMLADLYVQVDSQIATTEPGGRIRVQANDMFTRHVGGEWESTFGAVKLKKPRPKWVELNAKRLSGL